MRLSTFSVTLFLLFSPWSIQSYDSPHQSIFEPQPIPVPNSEDDEPLLSHDLVQRIKDSGAPWHASAFQDRFDGYTIRQAKTMLQPIQLKASHVPTLSNHNQKAENDFILNATLRDDFALPVKRVEVEGIHIPDFFDARHKWFDCQTVSMIRDQGNCGACWAFGSVGTMSDRICIGTNGRDQAIVSARDLMFCCPDCTVATDPCESGYTDLAFRYWKEVGLVTGGNWKSSLGCQPYPLPIFNFTRVKPYLPKCHDYCTERRYRISYAADKRRAVDVYRLEPLAVQEMQVELMERGPMTVGFDVYKDFFHYAGGVYSHVDGPLMGRHEVKLLGWGTENGTDYWTIANSWNQAWGLHGYFKIKRGVNECRVESEVLAGVVDPNWMPSWEGRVQ